MGTWGTGIYSDDTASDIKILCNEIFPFVSVEEGNQIIFEEYKEIINSNILDNTSASFWYALADWQWNHGILDDSIKERALALLHDYVGISEWEESGSKADVKKRKAVLDKLREKLETAQPPKTLPKVRLEKPKHKAGDIIVFQMNGSRKGFESAWQIEYMSPGYVYKSTAINERITDRFEPAKDFSGNFAAVICIGSVKEPYSHHISGIYNEKSVYAIYNYCKPEKPTLESLSKCGFLPHIAWICDLKAGSNHGTTVSIDWEYKFTFIAENFKKESGYLGECFTLYRKDEVERFTNLLARKTYSQDYHYKTDLCTAFSDSNSERLRLMEIGISIDDLLDMDIKNPNFRIPDELDRIGGLGKYR